MPGRFLVFVLFLAALATAATYWHTIEKTETLTDPGLADLDRRATVHGWPWGYYAEVMELARVSERQVAVIEYGEVDFEMFGQTFLAWFVVSLILVFVLVIFTQTGQTRV